jgi:non-heme chloroperoxidase
MCHRFWASLPLLAFGLFLQAASAQTLPGVADRYFLSSDGVRLHYLEAGLPTAHTIIFVPGWTMPAWIWAPQIAAFEHSYHVVAFDPRGQGDSQIAASGYEPRRRGQDIAELIARMGQPSVLLVGWSLGVLDALAYVHADGDRMLAGLVLVDNSVVRRRHRTRCLTVQADPCRARSTWSASSAPCSARHRIPSGWTG